MLQTITTLQRDNIHIEKLRIMKNKIYIFVSVVFILAGCANEGSKDVGLPQQNAGVGGSLARFTIANNSLYIVDGEDLHLYDISNPSNPQNKTKQHLGFGIETVFPYKDALFVGSQNGMYIFDISDPNKLKQLAIYSHITSCDPVVAQGNRAFVTLRSGTNCSVGANLLDVIDISNLAAPKFLKSYPMQNPHGLSIDGNDLFVCEGKFGMKQFDATNPDALVEKKVFEEFFGYDVITLDKNLMVIGKDGLYQYDYSDADNVKFLSKIDVN